MVSLRFLIPLISFYDGRVRNSHVANMRLSSCQCSVILLVILACLELIYLIIHSRRDSKVLNNRVRAQQSTQDQRPGHPKLRIIESPNKSANINQRELDLSKNEPHHITPTQRHIVAHSIVGTHQNTAICPLTQ